MKIGYGFWGFLGDKKFNAQGQEASTPDGNAFYSWSIIHELQKQGHEVYALMPDRDIPGYKILGENLFNAFASEARFKSYFDMYDYIDYDSNNALYDLLYNNKEIQQLTKVKLDAVLWEWRMPIPGRNTDVDIQSSTFQPDYLLQDKLLTYFKKEHIPVILFDLDYKIKDEDIEKYNIRGVLDLGTKWRGYGKCETYQTSIPFDFTYINDYEIKEPTELIVYVGNRYERDWCIDKYIPEDVEGVTVYGNWLESGRDSAERWPKIKFGKRLQLDEMYEAYSKASVTPLLAKKEYCEKGFMTARIIESVLYGCLPLFIEEFDMSNIWLNDTDKELVEKLTIHSKEELVEKAKYYMEHPDERKELIRKLRFKLNYMSAKNFVADFLYMLVD